MYFFGFKGLTGKVFKNQSLSWPGNAQNGFGAVSRAVFNDGTLVGCPQSESRLSRIAGWPSVMALTAWM